MRLLALVPDAFGGHGGIALYGRSVLRALCQHPSHPDVVAVARVVPLPLEPMSVNLFFHDEFAGSKAKFAAAALKECRPRPDLVICGHLNLLPIAAMVAAAARAPLIQFIYGMEAWRPHPNPLVRALLPGVGAIVAIRRYTANRFRAWSRFAEEAIHFLENPIALERYAPGPPNPVLLERYQLVGKEVLLTLARVENDHFGFDEIIDALPQLVDERPTLRYVVAGRGDHVDRLRKKAEDLGVGARVVFTGFVKNDEKADHYRLARAFAMPGSDARFFDRYPLRFVTLEALACGLPVVMSDPEEPDEVPAGLPYFSVNPLDSRSVAAGVRAALDRGPGAVPPELEQYDLARFTVRLHAIVDRVLAARRPAPGLGTMARAMLQLG